MPTKYFITILTTIATLTSAPAAPQDTTPRKFEAIILGTGIPIPPTDPAEQAFTQGMAEIYQGPIIVARDGLHVTP